MTELVRYEAARSALAAARSVDEVLGLRDRASQLAAYARIARDRGLECDAAELRFRAERKLGEMIAAQRDTIGLAPAGRRPVPADAAESGAAGTRLPPPARPSLAEAGIGKRLAQTARVYAAMPEATFEARLGARRTAIEAGKRKVTLDLVDDDKAARRAEREARLGATQCALPQRRYGVIYDDPEWRHEVFSRETGLDRCADNHYPTSPLADIFARGHELIEAIAAPDCAWFRWTTNQHLAHALRSIEIGGFTYRSNFVWDKGRISTGFWNRSRHEILLLAVRGAPPCPAPGTQAESLFRAAPTRHSAKPECVLEMIERYFPTLPRIELNRRGPPRAGWDAWGNEAELDDAAVAA